MINLNGRARKGPGRTVTLSKIIGLPSNQPVQCICKFFHPIPPPKKYNLNLPMQLYRNLFILIMTVTVNCRL